MIGGINTRSVEWDSKDAKSTRQEKRGSMAVGEKQS
jgi:hypothetical protein